MSKTMSFRLEGRRCDIASGKNHDRAILLFTPIWLVTATHYAGLELGVIVGASHFLGGWYLSPDLDLKSAPWRRWNLLRFIWILYQKQIPHRNWKSHAPIAGSVIRVIYLAAWLSPVLAIPGADQMLLSVGWEKAIACFVGVELSAINHLLLDGLLIPLPKSIKKRLS